MAIVAEIVTAGPFFAGDTGPTLELIMLWDSGGYVNLAGATITVNVRRWNPTRKLPVGPLVTAGDGTHGNDAAGQLFFDWNGASPVSAVPLDSGPYMLQADVTFPTGNEQLSQRCVFEVLPA